MIQYQRQDEILSKLEQQQTMSVKKLARLLYTSEATIRRDLNTLEQMGLVYRIYGGVVLAKYANHDMPLFVRRQENAEEKDRIAAEAAAMVPDGATILLDASSTVQHMVKYLFGRKGLTVITNCLKVIEKFSESKVEVLCTGGRFLPDNAAFVGYQAEEMLRGIQADYVFFSSQGITLEGDICDNSEAETAVRRVMLDRAGQKIFLCDSSKIGRRGRYCVCRAEKLNRMISEAALPEQLAEKVRGAGSGQ